MAGPRLSQYYNQVVGLPEESGEIQVRRLYADVLITGAGSGATVESVNQAISFTDSAAATSILNQSATSNLTLTDSGKLQETSQSVNSDLTLNHSAVGVRNVPVSAVNALTLTSLGGRVFTVNADSVISLSELLSEFNYIDDRKPAEQVLTFTQSVEVQGSKFLEHALGLQQTVGIVFPIKPTVIQPLVLSQHTSTPYHFWVEHALGFSQTARVALPTQHVSDTINFTHAAPLGRVAQDLGLTDSVLYAFSDGIVQEITLDHELDRTMIYVRTITHADFIGHALTWYEDTPCGRKQYTPFQGESTIPGRLFTAPSDDLQDPQGDTGNFSIYTPYLGVKTDEVVLRNPELDNRDRSAFTRVNQESRGGKLIVYSDPQWPKVRTLAVTIVGLLESKVDEFQDFMLATLGQEIGLTDWEGRLWKGFITNPNEEATQDGRGRWTVTFEFEGEMLEVEQPGNDNGGGMALNITQSVMAVIV